MLWNLIHIYKSVPSVIIRKKILILYWLSWGKDFFINQKCYYLVDFKDIKVCFLDASASQEVQNSLTNKLTNKHLALFDLLWFCGVLYHLVWSWEIYYGLRKFCIVLYCLVISCMVFYGLVWSLIVIKRVVL